MLKLDLRWVDRDQSGRDFCADHGRTGRQRHQDIHCGACGCAPVECGRDSSAEAHQGSERCRHRWVGATGVSGCPLPTHRRVLSRAARASDSARETFTSGPPIFDGNRSAEHRVNRDGHCGSPVASGPVDCTRPRFLRRSERSACYDRNRSGSAAGVGRREASKTDTGGSCAARSTSTRRSSSSRTSGSSSRTACMQRMTSRCADRGLFGLC